MMNQYHPEDEACRPLTIHECVMPFSDQEIDCIMQHCLNEICKGRDLGFEAAVPLMACCNLLKERNLQLAEARDVAREERDKAELTAKEQVQKEMAKLRVRLAADPHTRHLLRTEDSISTENNLTQENTAKMGNLDRWIDPGWLRSK